MISREFDISIGSVVVLAGVVAILLIDHVGAPWAIVLATSVGVGTGAFNGFLVVRLGINSFIATLGSIVIFQGLAFALTDMRSIATESVSFHRLGAESWWGLPLPVLYFVVLALIIWFISRFTLLGKHAYAIGGREEACRLMGIAVGRQKFVFFVITGVAAAFAGVILASRLNSASAVFGENVALVVIAAIVIGGVQALKKAAGRGLPVLCFNSSVDSPKSLGVRAYTGPQYYEQGAMAARVAGRLRPEGKAVIITGTPG